MHPTVAANHQHRLDDATGKWKRVRAGVYENFDGWKIIKTRDGRRWEVRRPDGTVATKWSEPTLTWAKIAAEKLISETAEQAALAAGPEYTVAPAPNAWSELTPGTLVEAVPSGTQADGAPITRTIRRRLDRAPWGYDPARGTYVISDGQSVDVVRADSVRILEAPMRQQPQLQHQAADRKDSDRDYHTWCGVHRKHHGICDQPARVDPVAVDTRLAELLRAAGKARQAYAAAAERARGLVGERKVYVGRSRRWQTSNTKAMENLQAAKDAGTLDSWDVAAAERALAMAAKAEIDEAAALAQAEPLNALYNQHRWSRFFTVPGGHIHSGQVCRGGTIRLRTQVEWNPGLSGLTEEDAVQAKGPHLCSHCFPSAPLDWRMDPKAKTDDPDTCKSVELTQAQRDSINWRRTYITVKCECTATVSVTSTGRKRKHKRGDLATTKK